MAIALTIVAAVLAVWAGVAAHLVNRHGLTVRQAIFYAPFKLAYRIDDREIATARKADAPVVYVVVHASRLDPALMLSLLPADTLHILDGPSARSIWLEPWRELARCIAFNAKHVFVSRRLVRHLKGRGRLAVYFPDTVEPDARAFRLYRAVGRIAARAEATIVPVMVAGSRESALTFADRQAGPRRLLPRLRVRALPPLTVEALMAENGAPQVTASNAFFDRVAQLRLAAADTDRTLFGAVAAAARRHGSGRVVLEDESGETMRYGRLLVAARLIGRHVAEHAKPGEPVGIMLANSNAVVALFLAVQSAGRVAAMINFSAGSAGAAEAVGTGGIRTVFTARRFVEQAGLAEMVAALEAAGARVVYLEDLRASFTRRDTALAALARGRPLAPAAADAAAVMLFTSGSEGRAKAVLLSHRNLLTNVAQAATRIAFSPADTLFNVLPVFHAFGLTGGTLLPLTGGLRLFSYPSPLHYRKVPETVARVKPTVMFGTDTFLAGYARTAGPDDFASLRFVVAGAEAVRPQTRRTWRERFGVTILEGFGMTEASPVVAVNTATHGRDGTVGRLLPGIRARLEPVEGIAEGGRLYLSGPNVMLGYLTAEAPGTLVAPPDGWHDSGDIVSFDREGFVTVRGRARRFAKVAGEMVSLGAMEMIAAALWPEDKHAAVAVPDRRRGERTVLVTTAADADRDTVRQHCKRHGHASVLTPSDVVATEDIPVLGSGKIDYAGVRRLAAQSLGLEAAA